jgi:hypothetical protein
VSAQAHATAVLDRLRTHGTPVLTVHDGKVPDAATPPYVLVYFTALTPPAEAAADKVDLGFDSDVVDMSAYCHCVGANGQAARALTARVRAALLNWTPTVASRSCFPMRHIDNFQPQRDEQTGTTYFDVVDVYRLVTVPA